MLNQVLFALAIFCMAGFASNSVRGMPVEPWLIWLFQAGIWVTAFSGLGHVAHLW